MLANEDRKKDAGVRIENGLYSKGASEQQCRVRGATQLAAHNSDTALCLLKGCAEVLLDIGSEFFNTCACPCTQSVYQSNYLLADFRGLVHGWMDGWMDG